MSIPLSRPGIDKCRHYRRTNLRAWSSGEQGVRFLQGDGHCYLLGRTRRRWERDGPEIPPFVCEFCELLTSYPAWYMLVPMSTPADPLHYHTHGTMKSLQSWAWPRSSQTFATWIRAACCHSGLGTRPHYDPFDGYVERGWLAPPASQANSGDSFVAMAGASTLGCLRWQIGG